MPPAQNFRASESSARRFDAGYSRQTVLLLCAVVLVAVFTLTGFLSREFHKKKLSIAENWYERGNAALAGGHAREARDCYRNALIFEPQNTIYQLHLAQALAAFGNPEQSRAYLLNLLEQFPGDGEINLELARLAAQDGAVDAAAHYYHGAIYGAWDAKPVESRRAARLELSTFLVNRGEYTPAEAELIALAAGIPADEPGLHATAGGLFLRAGDINRALYEFETALKTAPTNLEALTGAGMTAYRLHDYGRAAMYLERAAVERSADSEIKTKLETSRMVLAADPFAPYLSDEERGRRAAAALSQVVSRAEKCQSGEPAAGKSTAPGTLLERTKTAQTKIWSERGLRAHPEQIAPAMRMVFDLESELDRTCGNAQGMDLALEMIRDLHADIATVAPAI
jgi:tetratricopeptide (TPR) repeat protein